eukprot:gene24156-9738_t
MLFGREMWLEISIPSIFSEMRLSMVRQAGARRGNLFTTSSIQCLTTVDDDGVSVRSKVSWSSLSFSKRRIQRIRPNTTDASLFSQCQALLKVKFQGSQITLSAAITSDKWNRRGMGRLLVACIMDLAKMHTNHTIITASVVCQKIPQLFWSSCGFQLPSQRDYTAMTKLCKEGEVFALGTKIWGAFTENANFESSLANVVSRLCPQGGSPSSKPTLRSQAPPPAAPRSRSRSAVRASSGRASRRGRSELASDSSALLFRPPDPLSRFGKRARGGAPEGEGGEGEAEQSHEDQDSRGVLSDREEEEEVEGGEEEEGRKKRASKNSARLSSATLPSPCQR